jgi:hypothetical protein
MRVTITPKFSNFLMANAAVYPYSRLKSTRNSMFCKWIMVKGLDRGSTEYFPVLANSLSNIALLELISSGKAKPFPPELSEIMDSMYWWGKTKNYEWYDDTIFYMGEECLELEYDRKELVRSLISFQVKVEIHEHFGVNSMAAELLWLDWISWFNATYQMAPKSFIGMARYSFEYVKWSITQVTMEIEPALVQS